MNFTQYISKLTAGTHHQQSEDDIRMGEVKRVIRQNAITSKVQSLLFRLVRRFYFLLSRSFSIV